MDLLLKKLNFKGQKDILVLDPPASFEKKIKDFAQYAEIFRNAKTCKSIEFVITFVTTQEQINHIVHQIAPRLQGDAVFWICYPKASSKKYKCNFNRDKGWDILGEYDMEGVRQVAIDEDWSALRFRKASYIKTMKRKFDALSKEGRKKIMNGNSS